jgi:serine phosphatase RsbU (regulator of sigma subunit)
MLQKIYTYLITIPTHIPQKHHRHFMVFNVASLCGFLAHLAFLIFFVVEEVPPLVYFNIGSVLIFAYTFFRNRKIFSLSVLVISYTEVIAHGIATTIYVGLDAGFYYYVFVLLSMGFLTSYKLQALVFMLLSIAASAFCIWYADLHPPLFMISQASINFVEYVNLISASIIVVAIGYYNSYTATKVENNLLEVNNNLFLQKQEIETQGEMIQHQKIQLEASFLNIQESIRYAKRIQNALLPLDTQLAKLFTKGYFVCYLPRDIVSGDFYWLHTTEHITFFAVADCTGHGVAGAMLTIIGQKTLENIVLEKGLTQPSLILDALHKSIYNFLKQENSNGRDGMDIGICAVHHASQKLYFSGAKQHLYYVQNHQLEIIKGDKLAIGGERLAKEVDKIFTNYEITMQEPTQLYMFTDGFQDQLGENNKKFMSKNLVILLEEIHNLPMSEQGEEVKKTFVNWKGSKKQVDDVLGVGVVV